jgi:hypothetical protein
MIAPANTTKNNADSNTNLRISIACLLFLENFWCLSVKSHSPGLEHWLDAPGPALGFENFGVLFGFELRIIWRTTEGVLELRSSKIFRASLGGGIPDRCHIGFKYSVIIVGAPFLFPAVDTMQCDGITVSANSQIHPKRWFSCEVEINHVREFESKTS